MIGSGLYWVLSCRDLLYSDTVLTVPVRFVEPVHFELRYSPVCFHIFEAPRSFVVGSVMDVVFSFVFHSQVFSNYTLTDQPNIVTPGYANHFFLEWCSSIQRPGRSSWVYLFSRTRGFGLVV